MANELQQLDGLDIEECQKRWKRLRDKYVREKKVRTGDAAPVVVSYEVLDILRETVGHKRLVYFKHCV